MALELFDTASPVCKHRGTPILAVQPSTTLGHAGVPTFAAPAPAPDPAASRPWAATGRWARLPASVAAATQQLPLPLPP
jgi:hypothetical protein